MSASPQPLHSSIGQHDAQQMTDYMIGHHSYMNPSSSIENGNNKDYGGSLVSSDLQSADNIYGSIVKQELDYHGLDKDSMDRSTRTQVQGVSARTNSDIGIINNGHSISGNDIIDKKDIGFSTDSPSAIGNASHFDLSLLGQNMGSRKEGSHDKKSTPESAFDQMAEITKTAGDININDQSMGSSLGSSLNAEINTAINNSVGSGSRKKATSGQNLSLQNFHLDPQDFQNFLMINPPIVEYSPYYYMMSMNGNSAESAANVANAAASVAQQSHQLNQQGQHNRIGQHGKLNRQLSQGGQLNQMNQLNQGQLNQGQVNPSQVNPSQMNPSQMDQRQMNQSQFSRNQVNANQMNQNQMNQNQINQNQINQTSQSQPNQPSTPMDQVYGFQSTNTDNGYQVVYPGQQMNANDSYPKLQQPQPRTMPRSALFNHRQSLALERPQSALLGSQSGMMGPNRLGVEPPGPTDADGPAVAYPPAPRRRLSISNGQIGQISMIVHRSEAQGEQTRASDENLVSDEDLGKSRRSDLMPHVQNSQGTSVPVAHVSASGGMERPRVPNRSEIEVDKDGVPKRQLIYNNEVIFNPNAGPIPGTAAWKRQRILERNRIAASRCRQKKKNLQKRLQQDVKSLKRKKQYLEIVVLGLKQKIRDYMKESGIGLDEILGSGNEDFRHSQSGDDTGDDYLSSSDEKKFKSSKNGKNSSGNKAALEPPKVTTDTLRKLLMSGDQDMYADLGSS
ncbi:hypothetical protein BRETT_005302 [Brettanomyces bruxellensis]|uniref:BZIP domain-containing protein n=1 Tax=Dekkera bruxellensis TaxID=5007 RepID=A0A871R7Z6_DEKBR|nr:uncharacterized protein BRETT_005302 [Brettanomyces bruxellensis]QOU18240.1 hypothetical protein BRETT_005302 [Brettanomyces bruxellensis]